MTEPFSEPPDGYCERKPTLSSITGMPVRLVSNMSVAPAWEPHDWRLISAVFLKETRLLWYCTRCRTTEYLP